MIFCRRGFGRADAKNCDGQPPARGSNYEMNAEHGKPSGTIAGARGRAGRRLTRQCGAVAVALLALASAAFGQAKLDLTVSGPERFAKEGIQVQLRITNFTQADEPLFPEIPGCTVRSSGTTGDSTQVSIVNGQMSRRTDRTYVWEIIAAEACEVTIPSFDVRVDGKILNTRPVKFQVKPAGEELVAAEISCAEKALYVGQTAEFTLRIWIKPARVDGQLLDADTMLRILKQSPASLAPFTHLSDARTTTRVGADGNATQYYLYELRKDVVCETVGPPPVRDVVVGYNYPIAFARDFFGELAVRRARGLRVTPTITAPDVQALPTQGRPVNFSGAVGSFTIRAAASNTRVRVGDPIELTLTITGDGVLDSLPPPRLESQPGLDRLFRIPQEALAGRVEGNRKVFQQTLRARTTDATAVPAIEYPHFDPRRGEFVIARSEPIALTVSASSEFASADVVSNAAVEAPTSRPAVQTVDGLRGNELDEKKLLARSRPVSQTELWAAAVAPPTAYLLAWGWVALSRSRGGAAKRRAGALATARRRLDASRGAGASREVEAAISGYLADRFDQPPAKFVGPAAAEFLRARGAPEALVAQCRSLVERCQAATYAGGADEAGLAASAAQWLEQMERTPL